MALDRWRDQIRQKPGELFGATSFRSEPQPVKEFDGVTVRYLDVETSDRGLQPGVYVETNVSHQVYNGVRELRAAIKAHVEIDLMDKSKRSPSIGIQMDVLNGISFKQRFISPEGGLVLEAKPVMPSELDEALRGADTGTHNKSFLPKDRI